MIWRSYFHGGRKVENDAIIPRTGLGPFVHHRLANSHRKFGFRLREGFRAIDELETGSFPRCALLGQVADEASVGNGKINNLLHALVKDELAESWRNRIVKVDNCALCASHGVNCSFDQVCSSWGQNLEIVTQHARLRGYAAIAPAAKRLGALLRFQSTGERIGILSR